jgi:NitT/TauT family transport system substrate-binding protein
MAEGSAMTLPMEQSSKQGPLPAIASWHIYCSIRTERGVYFAHINAGDLAREYLEQPMHRRSFLKLSAAAGLASLNRPAIAQTRDLTISEPARSVGYLPIYLAIKEGYFKKAGLGVTMLTAEQNAAAINAALSGQTFAFLGGPERVAFARAQGGSLRSVVNCVDRGNVYFLAAKGTGPKDKAEIGAFLKGKRIVTGQRGTSPHSVMRYILMSKYGLDPDKDVQLNELPSAAILAAIKGKLADVAVASEPAIAQGIGQGLWDEPFYNAPKELGPLAYSVLNIQKSMIDKEPQLVTDFVAAAIEGLKTTLSEPDRARAIAAKEFPTMNPDDLKATMDRTYADDLWSPDGVISRQSWATMHSVVRTIGILKTDVPYEEVIDNSFVERLAKR